MDLFGADEEIIEDDVESAVPPQEPTELPHPRAATFSFGHEAVEKRLLEFYASEKMPHAIIFSGPKGIGKATMAFRFSRFLFKNGAKDENQDGLFGAPEPQNFTSLEIPSNDPVFSRVASGGHPDLLTVERAYDETKDKYKASVDVEEIRKVAPFFRMTASEGGWRIAIIDDADTMNRNAQNALLKILEEPPKNSLLILIAHRSGALIPTIRSRSRVIHFDPLTPDTLKDLLARQGTRLSAEQFSMLWNLSGGSFGRALQVIESEGLAMAGRILDLLEDNPRDWVAIHKFAESLAGVEEGAELFADILQAIYGQLAKVKARGGAIEGFGVHKPVMEKTLARSSLEGLLNICESLRAHFAKLSTGNLDRRQGVLAAFSLIS